jgi:quinol monooxygenase YgiN
MHTVRNVQFHVTRGKVAELTKPLTNDATPALTRPEGYNHEFAMVNGDRALGISIWKDRASAEKYESTGYMKVLEKLSPVIEGTPKVETYELAATSLPF